MVGRPRRSELYRLLKMLARGIDVTERFVSTAQRIVNSGIGGVYGNALLKESTANSGCPRKWSAMPS